MDIMELGAIEDTQPANGAVGACDGCWGRPACTVKKVEVVRGGMEALFDESLASEFRVRPAVTF